MYYSTSTIVHDGYFVKRYSKSADLLAFRLATQFGIRIEELFIYSQERDDDASSNGLVKKDRNSGLLQYAYARRDLRAKKEMMIRERDERMRLIRARAGQHAVWVSSSLAEVVVVRRPDLRCMRVRSTRIHLKSGTLLRWPEQLLIHDNKIG
jgi:hypothetical protein